jgi:hypothetical protein
MQPCTRVHRGAFFVRVSEQARLFGKWGTGAPIMLTLSRLVHLAYSAAYMIPLCARPTPFSGLDLDLQRSVAHKSFRLS